MLRFLIRNQVETPAGVVRKQAHDYGLVVLLYGAVDHFAPEADRATLRDALRASLHQDAEGARRRATALATDEGRRLWRLVEAQRLQELAPAFEAIVRERGDELARLSPAGRLAGIGVPVYVVHGAGDSVIPPAETEWAARELGDAPPRRAGDAAHRARRGERRGRHRRQAGAAALHREHALTATAGRVPSRAEAVS